VTGQQIAQETVMVLLYLMNVVNVKVMVHHVCLIMDPMFVMNLIVGMAVLL
jgi:hypothetical protein